MKNVLPIKGRYVCSLDTVGEEKLKRTVVLQTSMENKLMRQSRIQYQNTQNYDPTLTGNQIKKLFNPKGPELSSSAVAAITILYFKFSTP